MEFDTGLRQTMSGTLKCEECGAALVRAFRSDYVSCPNLHGKLIKLDKNQKFSWRNPNKKREAKSKWLNQVPEAVRVGSIYTSIGKDGVYSFNDGSGYYLCNVITPATKDSTVLYGDRIGKIKSGRAWLPRFFTPVKVTEKQEKRFLKKASNGPKET
jgi:hypothetical protein